MGDKFESGQTKVQLPLNKRLHIDEASRACELQRYILYQSE
jgi:hypothetical protein